MSLRVDRAQDGAGRDTSDWPGPGRIGRAEKGGCEGLVLDMWKKLGIIVVVLLLAPVAVGLIGELIFDAGGTDVGLWALLATVALFFYQRSQFANLRRTVERDLAALRDQLGAQRSSLEAGQTAQSEVGPVELQTSAESEASEAPIAMPTQQPLSEVARAEHAAPAIVLAQEPPVFADAAEPVSGLALPAEGAFDVDQWSTRVTSSLAASIRAWFSGGNTIVRVAVLILFVGVAFLLRYAVEHEMLPIEIRLAAVAAGGIALLAVGWRLRLRRRGYGLTLQGAGIGVLYMTLFAAMRLYAVLPPLPTLALLVAVAGLAALLALWQDALPLAVVGFVGGFAAPLLASSGVGSHVLLFSYCGVLNLAIAAIASRKAWKLLNLVGFVSTTLVALAWGASAWRPELLASTEPFLVGHLTLYLYITVQYARQLAPPAAADTADAVPMLPYVDAGLMFGVPLAAAGLQAVLVRHVPYALAASAAVMSAVYLLLGRWLWRRAGERLRLLTEGMLALGAVFLMLVAPLAVDARWTAAAWAVQGAGMVWVALRQRRPWALHFGLVLQGLAALSFWGRLPLADEGTFVANARFAGVVLLAAAAFVCARLLQRVASAPANDATPRGLAPPLLGNLHWVALAAALLHLVAGVELELRQAPWVIPDRTQSLILWMVLLAVALEAMNRRLAWPELSLAARPLLGLPVLMSLGDSIEAASRSAGWSRLWPAGFVEVAVVLVAAGWLLRRLDTTPRASESPRPKHPVESLVVAWYAMVHGALAVNAVSVQFIADHSGWDAGGVIVVPTALAWLVLSRLASGRWPMDRDGPQWIAGLALPWMALLAAWSAAVNLFASGSMRPLPYLPLVNPVDLGHGLMLLYALRLRRALQAEAGDALAGRLQSARPQVAAVSAAVAFWWLSSALVRTLHHWMGTPMWLDGAFESGLVQTGLSILWTVIALATMFVATRRVDGDQARTVWLAGAALLGVVVVKLLLVDLSQTSALQRIVSFVGVGLLMLVVGYVAPLPPQPPLSAAK